MLNDSALRSQIKIDQHVAAEDDVYALHEKHAGIIGKIEAAEADAVPSQLLYLQLIPGGGEIFLPIVEREVARTVAAVGGFFGLGQRVFIQVRR